MFLFIKSSFHWKKTQHIRSHGSLQILNYKDKNVLFLSLSSYKLILELDKLNIKVEE